MQKAAASVATVATVASVTSIVGGKWEQTVANCVARRRYKPAWPHTQHGHMCPDTFSLALSIPLLFPVSPPVLVHESINACYIIFQSINFRVTRFAYNESGQGRAAAGRWDGPAPLTWPMNWRVNHMEWFHTHTHSLSPCLSLSHTPHIKLSTYTHTTTGGHWA